MAIRTPLSSIMCLIERGDRFYRHFYDLSKYFLPAVVSRSCIQRYLFKVVRKNKEALQLAFFFRQDLTKPLQSGMNGDFQMKNSRMNGDHLETQPTQPSKQSSTLEKA